MTKTKQNPSSNDRLGKTVLTSDKLIDSAKIIAHSNNPVKLITAQIRYQMLIERMYRENLARK